MMKIEATRKIGHPVQRVYNNANERYSWWVRGPDNTLYQNFTPDGEVIMRRVLQPDGSVIETQ